jgi:hypothetical protein
MTLQREPNEYNPAWRAFWLQGLRTAWGKWPPG